MLSSYWDHSWTFKIPIWCFVPLRLRSRFLLSKAQDIRGRIRLEKNIQHIFQFHCFARHFFDEWMSGKRSKKFQTLFFINKSFSLFYWQSTSLSICTCTARRQKYFND
jgi:hypothetical protein